MRYHKGSFGTLDEVSKTILPQAQGVTSRMVDSYTDKKAYVYDYVINQEGRPEKHIKVDSFNKLSIAKSILVFIIIRCVILF